MSYPVPGQPNRTYFMEQYWDNRTGNMISNQQTHQIDDGLVAEQDRIVASRNKTGGVVDKPPGESLLTNSGTKKRKRILGLGKDNTSGSDGTVAREQLSGE